MSENIRTSRLARELLRISAGFLDSSPLRSPALESLLAELREQYPGLRIDAYESSSHFIELTEIEVPEKNQGIGTRVIRKIQEYARQTGKPIVLRPYPESRKKQALMRFYKNLGFIINKGRNTDYTLSSPFSLTMYWKP